MSSEQIYAIYMSPELDKFAPAFIKFQQEVKDPRKNSLNPHFKNKFVSLEDTLEAVRPVLNNNGFTLSQWRVGRGLTTLILHESGQYIYSDAELILEKLTPQAVGSATTYERRYGALGATGTSGDVDDDAELAHGRGGHAGPRAKGDTAAQQASSDEIKQVARFVEMIESSTKLVTLKAVGTMIESSPLTNSQKDGLRPMYASKLHELGP